MNHAQYDLCDAGVYSRGIINMFFVGRVSGLVENFNNGIFSDTLNVINVKLCTMVLFIEFYLFIPLSVTLTIFQGHRYVSLHWKFYVVIWLSSKFIGLLSTSWKCHFFFSFLFFLLMITLYSSEITDIFLPHPVKKL